MSSFRYVVLRVASLGGLVGLLVPATGYPCSPQYCEAARMVPGFGATVPANLPAIWFQPKYDIRDIEIPADLPIRMVDDRGQPVAFTSVELQGDRSFLLRPVGLEPGRQYTVTASVACEGALSDVTAMTFSTAEAVPFPTALGEVTYLGNFEGTYPLPHPTACTMLVESLEARFELRLHESAEPWGAVLFPGGTNFARDLVCATEYGDGTFTQPVPSFAPTQEGRGELKVAVTLLGTDVELEAAAVPYDLSCSTPDTTNGCMCASAHDQRPSVLAFLVGLAALVRRRGSTQSRPFKFPNSSS